ncbi:MAG: winged helix-turn-helix domain-containing protein [Planctomycetaceae bacterium]|nr:winged helix-turn-helix domain-containing protein [Planctomycetaceae bacterium]
MPTRIRPGQFYLARFTKNELLVRIEEAAPQGGWVARSLSHGRKVMIKEDSQIIHACDENGIELVADVTIPNRRSTALPPEPKPNTAILSNEPPVQNACPPVMAQPISTMVYHAEPCSLLDAAAMILREKHRPMSSREIVDAVVEQRLWTPSGKTPWLTLHSALTRDMESKGAKSRFTKSDERGKFTLRK